MKMRKCKKDVFRALVLTGSGKRSERLPFIWDPFLYNRYLYRVASSTDVTTPVLFSFLTLML